MADKYSSSSIYIEFPFPLMKEDLNNFYISLISKGLYGEINENSCKTTYLDIENGRCTLKISESSFPILGKLVVYGESIPVLLDERKGSFVGINLEGIVGYNFSQLQSGRQEAMKFIQNAIFESFAEHYLPEYKEIEAKRPYILKTEPCSP